MTRDPLDEIVQYNKPLLKHVVPSYEHKRELTREALGRKLEALAESAFRFFRGTFHLMSWDVIRARVPLSEARTPEGLIVGDLHLENFGIYRGQSGELCFDVNDFDDVGYGPLDLDLKRLCTSAFLLPGLSGAVREQAARAIARGWADETKKLGGRFPVNPWTVEKASEIVKRLLRERGRQAREDFLSKVAPGKGHKSLENSEKFVRLAAKWRRIAERAFSEYCKNLHQLRSPDIPDGWKILDIAYEFKGTGSLGRLRFAVLTGKGNDRRLFELKEARPSAMDAAREATVARDRGRAQTAAIRRLQGDPWPRVAATHLGPLAALGRENDPSEEKIPIDRFAHGGVSNQELCSYAHQCGEVLARLHCRFNAPTMFNSTWDVDHAARAALAFAEKYALQVKKDQALFSRGKSRVAQALGL